jgi:transcriptional regulator with GAF, ATPase, and Fis domain
VVSDRPDQSNEVEQAPLVRASVKDRDLAASLAALAGLSARSSLMDVLTDIASFAAQAIPGADGAGLTLLEPGRADISVETELFVKKIEEIQHSLGEGPCVAAAADGQPVRSGSLGVDRRWPRLGPQAGRLGVHSVLSLPLCTPDRIIGAMNVYAHDRDIFDERAEQIGMVYAVPATVAVQNAQALAHATRLAEKLQTALDARAVIEQAIGIIRARSGISAEVAHQRLRVLSRNQRGTVVQAATGIVTAAISKAQQRRTTTE